MQVSSCKWGPPWGGRNRSCAMFTIPGPVILDLNSQRDLLATDGTTPVFQAEKLYEPLRKLFVFAHRNQVPVISTRFNHLTTPGQKGGVIAGVAPGGGAGKLICHP